MKSINLNEYSDRFKGYNYRNKLLDAKGKLKNSAHDFDKNT